MCGEVLCHRGEKIDRRVSLRYYTNIIQIFLRRTLCTHWINILRTRYVLTNTSPWDDVCPET